LYKYNNYKRNQKEKNPIKINSHQGLNPNPKVQNITQTLS